MTLRVGIQLEPQHCSFDDLRRAWRGAEECGADSIWLWDHFFPLSGDPHGRHFEGWTLLTVMACDTSTSQVGVLVTGNSYRNPNLLADMARTVDHVSGGRTILGLGAGWCERDYDEYGYSFGTAASRVKDLERDVARIHDRLQVLNPPPVGSLPICIGGEGERVTLRIAATHADMWNGFGPPETFAHKNRVLDGWCTRVGRDPSQIERSVLLQDLDDVARPEAYVQVGAEHLIVSCRAPFDLAPLQRLIDWARRA